MYKSKASFETTPIKKRTGIKTIKKITTHVIKAAIEGFTSKVIQYF